MQKKNFSAGALPTRANGKTDEVGASVTFPASLQNVNIKDDGSVQVKFEVPRSALGEVVTLSALVEAGLSVTVRVTSKQGTLPMDGGSDGDE